MKSRILVTGGAGFIGSHTVVQLLEAGHDIVVLDNFSNSHQQVFERISRIAGRMPEVINGDVRDPAALRRVFSAGDIQAVIHLAGLKAVGRAQADPLQYYSANVAGSLSLLQEMERANVRTLVFSSSATVYGEPKNPCCAETAPLQPVNVYGRTKHAVENILRDLHASDARWRLAILRYFNPVGAHASALIGEDPLSVPNNLMPFITQVSVGLRPRLKIFGADYPTADGTGERDYIHVEDLSRGHLAALTHLKENPGCYVLNLGTGRPYSVLEVVRTFEAVSGQPIPYDIVDRRAGDLPCYFADPSLAEATLGWKAQHDLRRMCEDAWRWQQKNPYGYRDAFDTL